MMKSRKPYTLQAYLNDLRQFDVESEIKGLFADSIHSSEETIQQIIQQMKLHNFDLIHIYATIIQTENDLSVAGLKQRFPEIAQNASKPSKLIRNAIKQYRNMKRLIDDSGKPSPNSPNSIGLLSGAKLKLV